MNSEINNKYSVKENLVNQIWTKYIHFWPMFLLMILLSLAATWLYLKYKLPVYETYASLLIKDEKKGIEDSKTLESLNPLSSKKIIENEIEVIKSKALMTQVVNDLKLYAPIFEKSKWKDVPAYKTSPIKIEVRNHDSVAKVERMEFLYNQEKSQVSFANQSYPTDKWVNTPLGILKFTKTNKVSLSKGPFYFSLVDINRVVQDFSEKLNVTSAGKLSTVLYLKLKDEVPSRSEDILNTLIQVYNKAALNDKNMLAANALSFLDERLKIVAHDLDSIERRLQNYKSFKGAIDIGTQGKLYLQNVSDNDQRMSNINMKMSVLNQVQQFVFSNNSNERLVPTTVGVDEPILTNLLNKLYELEASYEVQKRTAGENNPETQSIVKQIQQIKPNISEYIHSQKESLELDRSNLYRTNNMYNGLLQALPEQERGIIEINREQNIKSSIYTFLLQKREEVALSYSSTVSDSRLVDKASSSLDPLGLGGKTMYIVAVIIAIGFGAMIITIRELLNTKILFRHDIEAITSYPIIGEIIQERSKLPSVLKDVKTSSLAEEFRMLRTSLQYLGIGLNGKKILITSTLPGEGKSFIALNLGVSIATSGKRVVIVEFDLSNPTLSKKIGITGRKGVTDYLLGKAGIDEIVIGAGATDGLFLITAGNLTDNPSDLILKAGTQNMLQYLDEKFDYVIIDSAPVGVLSGAYVLAKYCDATLYIVRHDYTKKNMLMRLQQNSKINGIKNLGIVFNGTRNGAFGRGIANYQSSLNSHKTDKKNLITNESI